MTILHNKLSFKERRRELRHNQTDAENVLWQRIRGRQILNFKFYRQFSVGAYIMDFYAPQAKLGIELDGGQHAEANQEEYDQIRTDYLTSIGIRILRFWNYEVMNDLVTVTETINNHLSNLILPPSL